VEIENKFDSYLTEVSPSFCKTNRPWKGRGQSCLWSGWTKHFKFGM